MMIGTGNCMEENEKTSSLPKRDEPTETKPPTHTRAGKFAPGNKLGKGKGNPNARKVHDYRAALHRTVTAADIVAVFKMLVTKARAGERWAATELLDRVLGKSVQPIDANIVADTTTTIISSLLTDDSADRAATIARIIASRTTALQEQPAAPMLEDAEQVKRVDPKV